jgi:hypothetical protein
MAGKVILLSDVYGLGAAVLGIAALGAWLMTRGRRGRVVGEHLHCRPCGYDLTGLGERAGRCPECGADLASPRAVTIGRQERRVAWIWVGGLLLISALAMAIRDVRLGVRAWEVDANRPVWWLRRQLTSTAKPADRDRAFAELSRRREAKQLSSAQMEAVARALIDLQGNPSGPWKSQWGTFVSLAHSNEALAEADWIRYADQAIVCSLRCRTRVRNGDPLSFDYDFGLRAHRHAQFWGEYHLTRAEVSGISIDLRALVTPRDPLSGMFGPYGHELTAAMLARARITEGPQTLKLIFDVEVHAGPQYDDTAAARAVLFRKTVTREVPWVFVPADEQTVELARSPELDAAVRAGVGPPEVTFELERNDAGNVVVDNIRNRAPISMASSVYIRAGQREWFCGRTLWDFSRAHLANFDADHVDVILRPDVDLARHTIGVTRIWGGELVFRNVAVRWVDKARNPVTRPTAR